MRNGFAITAAIVVGVNLLLASPAFAQKQGGTLRIYHRDDPPSASPVEEATVSTNMPFMGVYSNLVLFDQTKNHASMATIIPELATSWSWDAGQTKLTFKLREGVTWHDGKPFTAKDVQCTWNTLQGKTQDKLRKNPRKIWYENLKEVTVNGDLEATFELMRPQPSFLVLLASGFSPVYPCHVAQKDMRTKPIGTGPFKFAEFKHNESVKLVRNPDYWRKGRPYVDAIEFRIIANRSTRLLAFTAGEFDMTFDSDISAPLLKDIKSQAPNAICDFRPSNVPRNLLVNRDAPPFNDAKIRKALALTIDRKTFIDILAEGKADIGASMLPPPEGDWGMPAEMLQTLPGYGTDVAKNQAEGRQIMESLGYGPDKLLKVKISTRNIEIYRDAAVLLIDQMKKIHVDGELEVVDTSIWFSKVARRDYTVGMNLTGASVDDPDASLYESYACKSERNYTNYCNPEVDKLIDQQSAEPDVDKRKKLVWEIERRVAEDVVKPVIFHDRAATCWHPHVKGMVIHNNTLYSNWRFDEVWLEK